MDSDTLEGVPEPPHVWDRLHTETLKSHSAFLAYVAMGARRGVREAARQHHSRALAAGEISSAEDTTVSTWMGWSAKHKWVSRANARDTWIANVSDEQIAANLKADLLALTTRAHDFLTSNDSADFLRAARALSLHFPPVQRVADVSERIEDWCDIPDEALERMGEIRDAARAANKKET